MRSEETPTFRLRRSWTECLEQCTVAVNGCGTGFFVAPGFVLTCAHVLGANPEIGGTVKIMSGENELTGFLERILDHPDEDIALIKVGNLNHRCVILDTGTVENSSVPVKAIGFPLRDRRQVRDGIDGTIEYSVRLSGDGRNQRLIKFKDGQVEGGFSGGPLLNLETGQVVGVVTETRGPGTNLGGLAIPSVFVIEQLSDLLARHPSLETRWFWLQGARSALDDSVMEASADILAFRNLYIGTDAQAAFGGRGLELLRLNLWLHEGKKQAPLPDLVAEINSPLTADQESHEAEANSFCLLTGAAGVGKSALLVDWVRSLESMPDQDVVFFPVSLRLETNRPNTFLRAVAQRLARIHGDNLIEASRAEDEARLVGRIREYLERTPPPGRQLLLVIDGIDELAGTVSFAKLFPLRPANGIKILVSSRSGDAGEILLHLGWDQSATCFHVELKPLDMEGVASVLQESGLLLRNDEPGVMLVHELFRLTGGDPLLLRFYVADLRAEGGVTRLDAAALKGFGPGLRG